MIAPARNLVQHVPTPIPYSGILRAWGVPYGADEEGYINEHLLYEVGERIKLEAKLRGSAARREGAVVDLVPELKRQELERRQRWTITKDELDYIAADIWPGHASEFPSIRSVKGKLPKKPRITWDAKEAIRDIARSVSQITLRLSMLNEIALQGAEHEARQMGAFDDEADLERGSR